MCIAVARGSSLRDLVIKLKKQTKLNRSECLAHVCAICKCERVADLCVRSLRGSLICVDSYICMHIYTYIWDCPQYGGRGLSSIKNKTKEKTK